MGQLGRRVAAGEPGQDDQEGIALADQGEPLGIIRVRPGHQAGRVEELDGRRRDLLGLVKLGEVVQAGIRERGHADLTRVDLARIGPGPGQEFEQRALAAPSEPDDSNLHSCPQLGSRQ